MGSGALMADTIYNVKDPTGAMRQIRGPEGASDEEIIAQAQKLFSSPQPAAPAQPAAPQRDVLKEAAPFYLGPAGTPRAARDILHGIDTATNYLSNRAGEGATDVATSLGASPETAAKFGIASNIGVQAVPAVLGGGLASKASPALEWAATKLMKSTLTKPTPNQILSGNADKAIQTMLEKGISPTVGGMSEVGVQVGKLEN